MTLCQRAACVHQFGVEPGLVHRPRSPRTDDPRPVRWSIYSCCAAHVMSRPRPVRVPCTPRRPARGGREAVIDSGPSIAQPVDFRSRGNEGVGIRGDGDPHGAGRSVTRQLAAILEPRLAERDGFPELLCAHGCVRSSGCAVNAVSGSVPSPAARRAPVGDRDSRRRRIDGITLHMRISSLDVARDRLSSAHDGRASPV